MPPNFVGFVYYKNPSKVTYYDDTQMTDEAVFSLTEMRGKGEEDGRNKGFGPDSDFVKWIRRNS